jgi:hypothetical protein
LVWDRSLSVWKPIFIKFQDLWNTLYRLYVILINVKLYSTIHAFTWLSMQKYHISFFTSFRCYQRYIFVSQFKSFSIQDISCDLGIHDANKLEIQLNRRFVLTLGIGVFDWSSPIHAIRDLIWKAIYMNASVTFMEFFAETSISGIFNESAYS